MAFLPLIIGATVVSGIASYFSEQSQQEQMRRQIRRAQNLARESLIEGPDLARRLRDIDRLFNKRLISTLNTTALQTRRFANQNVVGAAVAGSIGAQAEESKLQTQDAIETRNANIRQYIASLEAGAPVGDPIGAAVEGGLAGAQFGLQASSILNKREINVPKTTPTITPMTNLGVNGQFGAVNYFRGEMENPFRLNVNPIEDDELYNFSPLSRLLSRGGF